MKQKQESVHNSTREIDHIQTSATVSYMCDGKSHNLLQDTTKRSKHSNTKVRYPHIGAKTVSLNLPAAEDKENDEVMQEDYDVAITHKQQCSEDEDDIDVTNFFGFRTPKRSKLSGKTPLKEQSETPATPSTNKRRARKLKLKSSTPSRLVARMTLDESVDDSTDSEGSEGSDDVPPDSFPSTICSSQQLPSLAEDFFHAQSQKQITSNHTLAKLREEGVLDQTSLKDILSTKCCQYGEGRQFLMEEHRAMFRKWMLQLCLGFNLILYGYGSKKGLLEEFRKTVCSDYHCVVINGFFPSITLKNIIVSICEDCLQLKEIPSDFDEVVLAIDEYLTSNGIVYIAT
ncbi:ORC2 [Bugula neritina]|uniref:Origin recognition complex subunit 2 n=1 Tax=Bugula neritina TaxID=10212 RepID=A0A7J7K125_BUGNE|nr:ORC2 [Bugula neritina]